MDKVIDFINVNREKYLEELKGAAGDPKHQRASRT